MLCISLRSSIKYPEDACIRQNCQRQKLTTVCLPVAELLWFCAQLHINYCFKCKQTWGGFWEKQHTQKIVVVAMCPLMIMNWLWLRPLQCEQILQSDKCSDNDEYYDNTYIYIYTQTYSHIVHGVLNIGPQLPSIITHQICDVKAFAQGHKLSLLVSVPGVWGQHSLRYSITV